MNRFEYHRPRTLAEAFDLMERFKGRAKYIAGGTDIMVRIRQKVLQPEALISLRGIGDLSGIGKGEGVSLGGMTLIREIERDEGIAESYPGLVQAARVLANPQVRNVATLAGNLGNAAPSADCAPPLLVLDARLTAAGPGGTREIPIDVFFTGPGRTCLEPGEILTRIFLPPREKHSGMAFLKTGRVNQDIAVVNASALLVMEGGVCRKCRLAVGAVAPVPLRLKGIEKIMEGEEIHPALLDRVGEMVEQEVSPITDVRSTEGYRRVLSGVLVKRAIRQAMENLP
jgi:CO/xanthine dehydrogenase FAD-binding subunit